jgi:glyoxylase-like metal-dependent hydrolase (beta-lactamase superfamily II)
MSRFVRRITIVGLLCVCLAGCEQERRVPYIPPTLANWPQPYHGFAGLKVHVFVTAILRLPEALVLGGGSLTSTRDLPIPVVLIEHPKQGLVLFSTGLDPKHLEESGPGAWMGLVGSKVVRSEGIQVQLQRAGFKREDVRWIVLSTLRFDHTGALRDFPNARVVVAKAEHEHALKESAGYEPGDFAAVANWKFIDFDAARPLATFLAAVDLFGDGSCMLLDASGVTPGTLALVVRLPQRPLLLAGDLASVEESVRYAAKPASASDLDEWWDHIWRLKRFKDLVPQLIVTPRCDLAPLRSAHQSDIVVHEAVISDEKSDALPTPDRLQRLLRPRVG